MATREFDLDIERVLENWTVAHAIRELIANALDEAALTGTAEPGIAKDRKRRWHVRDLGRGLGYEHLTQNENREKLAHPEQVVGKFGVDSRTPSRRSTAGRRCPDPVALRRRPFAERLASLNRRA